MEVFGYKFTEIILLAAITGIIILAAVYLFTKRMNKNKSITANDDLSFIDYTLNVSGYKLTPYGVGISLLSLNQGFSKEETFSHMALMALAQHVKAAGKDTAELSKVNQRGLSVAKNLNQLYKQELIRTEIYENDFNAVISVSTLNEEQEQWVDDVLAGNETSNKDTIALPIREQESIEAMDHYIADFIKNQKY